MSREIPKRLFMYWADGFDSAPEVVGLAVESWRSFNPDLEIVLLDNSNLRQFTSVMDSIPTWNQLRVSHQSDLLRLTLLAEHGGFWVDATLFCAAPLEDWLDFTPETGFVMLKTAKGKNRFTQTFFLGSVPSSWFSVNWLRGLSRILGSNARPMTVGTQKRWRRRRPMLWATPLSTCVWALLPWVRITGYPYLVAHYVANRLILTRPKGARTYRRDASVLAGEALHLQDTPDGASRFQESLRRGEFPIWKFSWRVDLSPEYWNDVFHVARTYLRDKTS